MLLAPLAFLGACQGVWDDRYVGWDEFDALARRMDVVEARVGLPSRGGGLPVLVSTKGAGPAPAGRGLPVGHLQAAPGGRPVSAEDAVYQEAQRLLKAGQYTQAAGVFSRMLAENPGGRLAPNARYWLGECYYAQGRYREAAGEFQRCADDYPKTDKAADALLKLSYSYNRLGDGHRAMAALDRLLGRYPNSNAAGLIKSGRGHF
ncbi:MAG: tol-pal system protein YbgF [Candidatus Adiutrix sp.]|nr:tol-pal system protein YbgF [Candidatus Adiutrix sp.]